MNHKNHDQKIKVLQAHQLHSLVLLQIESGYTDYQPPSSVQKTVAKLHAPF